MYEYIPPKGPESQSESQAHGHGHGHGLFIKTRVTEKFTPFPRRVPAVTHDQCLDDRRSSTFPTILTSRMVGCREVFFSLDSEPHGGYIIIGTYLHTGMHGCMHVNMGTHMHMYIYTFDFE